MATDTQIANDAQLIEMERMMRSAPEPGGLEGISMGDDGVEIRKTSVKSAGYVIMWNADTHEPSRFNMNSIRTKLREVFPADHPRRPGQPAWTARQPVEKPWYGGATCPLHASRPERRYYDEIGYPECSRINLPNDMEAREHLRKKHPATFRQMNEARAEVERLSQIEDRNINRSILAKLAGVELAPDPIPDPAPSVWEQPRDAPPAEEPAAPRVAKSKPPGEDGSSVYVCRKCQLTHQLTSGIGKRHKRHQVKN